MARRSPAACDRAARARLALLFALAATLAVAAGCGGGDSSSTPTTTDVETTPVTTVEETTPPPPQTTPAETKPRTIVVVVDQGRPRGGIKRPRLEKGEKVVLVIRADIGESVHVHGYDLEKPIAPGKPTRIPITATIPGRFEVELHHPDALLAVLEVRP